MIETEAIIKKNYIDKRDVEMSKFDRNLNSNKIINANYLTSSIVNNTQQSLENCNSFGGINQTFQTFKSNSILSLNLKKFSY